MTEGRRQTPGADVQGDGEARIDSAVTVPVSAKNLGIDLVTTDKLNLEVLKARHAALDNCQNGWAFSISTTSFGLTLCYGMHVIAGEAGFFGWAFVGLLFLIAVASGVVSFLSWQKKDGSKQH